MSVFELMSFNPLMSKSHEQRRTKLLNAFPELAGCEAPTYLSLWNYLACSPQKYFSEKTYAAYFDWLKNRHKISNKELRDYLSSAGVELNRGLLHLSEFNRSRWHDSIQFEDDYEKIKFIDDVIHPTYLRLVEAVLSPLLRMPAHFNRLDRSAGTDGLDMWNIYEELKGSQLGDALKCYSHIARNGIAHGGIVYLQNEISYTDKKGNEGVHSCSEMIRLTEDLVDTCNALVLALSVFLMSHQSVGYDLLQQVLIDELREETTSPYWEIIGCVPSRFSDQKQLLIYARTLSADYSKVKFSAICTGILAEHFAPGYDRYVLSFRSSKSLPGWTGFDGVKLRSLREARTTDLKEYAGVVENDLVFYVPNRPFPRFAARLETLWMSFRVTWPHVVSEFREQVGLATIAPRTAELHRNGLMSVLNGSVILEDLSGNVSEDSVRKSCRRIIGSALALAKKALPKNDPCRLLPLGYARISVFRRDYRCRRFEGFGLGSDLICTVQERRLRRIQSPDIAGSTIEQCGRFRIAWNRKWLEDEVN